MKNKLIIIISIIIIIVAGALYLLWSDEDNDSAINNINQFKKNINSNSSGNNNNTDVDQNPGCSDDLVFTNVFVEPNNIDSIGPIGALDGGSHGRSYVAVKEGGQVPVYAPGDATLEYIVYARRGPSVDYGEYGLWFRAGCDTVFLLDHLDSLSEELQALAPTEFSESSATGGPVIGYQVKAGELLAYTDGTDQARTFDFLVLDRSKQVEYINPDRFEWDQNNFSQCPYDLFTEDLKNEYYSLFNEPNNINKNCGTPSYDIAGTAAGAWFQGEDTDLSGRWLTFGTYTSYSGLMIRKDAGRDFTVRDYDPVIKPEDMKPGDEVCYDYNGNWAYAKLESAEQLLVATGTGDCPNNFSNDQAETWIR
ncbi:MAG: hypothetical protein Q8P20_04820 [bacterium]|nr:hypothetical protein [bacterium]